MQARARCTSAEDKRQHVMDGYQNIKFKDFVLQLISLNIIVPLTGHKLYEKILHFERFMVVGYLSKEYSY